MITNKRILSMAAMFAAVLCAAAVLLCAGPAHYAKADANIDYSNGTYATSGFAVDTGMFGLNTSDYAPYIVIDGDTATLVVTTDAAYKYDGIWIGKRANAAADAATAQVILGIPLYAENGYKGETYNDGTGKVRSYQFVIPFTTQQLKTVLEDSDQIDMYWVLRRAAWSPSNPGQWMGSADHYFTFGTLSKTSDSTKVPEAPSAGDETADIDKVKALIRALPTDSFDITSAHKTAIDEAKSAYDALSASDQKRLDSEICANNQSFGRILEAATWTITSFAAVDNDTSLSNGTYSSGITATSDMGKSTSDRQRGWTVQQVVVKDGKATARIKWDGNTALDSLRIGSQSYANLAKEGSIFEIPVDLNNDMYFAVKIKGATAATDAVTYHLVVKLDEANATPDKENDTSGNTQGGSDNKGGNNNSGSGNKGNTNAGSNSGAKNNNTPQDTNADNADNKESAGTKTSQGSGASGTAGASLSKPSSGNGSLGSSSKDATTSEKDEQLVQDPILNPEFAAFEEAADELMSAYDYDLGLARTETQNAGVPPWAVLLGLLIACGLGIAGFTTRFVKLGR